MLNISSGGGGGGGGGLYLTKGFLLAGFGGSYAWRGLFSGFYGIYLFSFPSRR